MTYEINDSFIEKTAQTIADEYNEKDFSGTSYDIARFLPKDLCVFILERAAGKINKANAEDKQVEVKIYLAKK